MRKLVLVLTGCLALAPQGVSATRPLIAAHRGVHQTYSREHLEPHTCTAERIFEPTHRYLENTLPSMAAAFRLGADVVEIDVHATRVRLHGGRPPDPPLPLSARIGRLPDVSRAQPHADSR